MGPTFSSVFENIHLEHGAVGSIFSSAFGTIQPGIASYGFDIQLYIQQHTHFEYRPMGSTFSSAVEAKSHPV